MLTYVALLRAVNLGVSTQVDMAELRAMVAAEGLRDARTWLRSGNLVFQGPPSSRERLERRLEAAFARRWRRPTEFFVRSATEWREVRDGNPFPAAAKDDPAHLVVAFLKGRAAPRAWAELEAGHRGPERLGPSGDRAYLTYPEGIGHSHLTAAVLERHLGTRVTCRNWTTVLRLDAWAADGPR